MALMLFRNPKFQIGVLLGLLLLNGAIVVTVVSDRPTMEVSFIDVGQGDGIYIKGPTGRQMIIDSGRDRSMLRGLGARMGLFDRTIDLAVETHPDADHIGGFPAVFSRYQIKEFMSPNIPNTTTPTLALTDAISREPGITTITAKRGMRIELGGGAYADILFPDRGMENETVTNDGSIGMRLVYGDASFMLTGDMPSPVEDWLVRLDGTTLESDVLKAGHHGSKFSTDDLWLAAVKPSVVVISAGKDNPYGHPAPETLGRIRNEGAAIVSTMDDGTITFVTDGKKIIER
jgi:beta-lactamase superfamily II metal-dependent hydrolase